jgi:energy-coupling factor transport system ATP-binding protein
LERVVQYADRVVVVRGDGGVDAGEPAEMFRTAPVAPPVVQLGRVAGWSPLPLTVRDARRMAGPLRERLAAARRCAVTGERSPPLASLRGITAGYGAAVAVRDVWLDLAAGEIVALMGRNGAGKSTLLGVLAGIHQPANGEVRVEPRPGNRGRPVGLVPQEPTDLLWAQRVEDECATADEDAAAPAGSTAALLRRLSPGIDPELHPRDLSEGQRLSLALAVVLAARPRVLALDEPTRGLDYAAKDQLVAALRDLAAAGHAVLLATHDVELAAEVADRIVVLADGEIVADGPAAEVAVGSPVFAPQVAKVLAPLPVLTVHDVVSGLGG